MFLIFHVIQWWIWWSSRGIGRSRTMLHWTTNLLSGGRTEVPLPNKGKLYCLFQGKKHSWSVLLVLLALITFMSKCLFAYRSNSLSLVFQWIWNWAQYPPKYNLFVCHILKNLNKILKYLRKDWSCKTSEQWRWKFLCFCTNVDYL